MRHRNGVVDAGLSRPFNRESAPPAGNDSEAVDVWIRFWS